jgi:nitroimidazol reductase NimA-like FMN-containing flavoprotein (pyridoxamine 5'-phosphate oxidase superfamily)
VGFVEGGQAYVVPTIHARLGDELLIHGSPVSRMLGAIGSGAGICVTVTLLDGLVFARSAFNHSMNYRSVMVLGRAEEIVDPHDKLRALKAIVDHVAPGRWAEARHPNDRELNATRVLSMALGEASAKIRTGPPKDGESDLDLPVWAGVLPLRFRAGIPEAADRRSAGIRVPAYIARYSRPGRRVRSP